MWLRKLGTGGEIWNIARGPANDQNRARTRNKERRRTRQRLPSMSLSEEGSIYAEYSLQGPEAFHFFQRKGGADTGHIQTPNPASNSTGQGLLGSC